MSELKLSKQGQELIKLYEQMAEEGYKRNDGIDVKNANNPIWIMGTLTVERATTELAEVGYYMADALIESYSDMY